MNQNRLGLQLLLKHIDMEAEQYRATTQAHWFILVVFQKTAAQKIFTNPKLLMLHHPASQLP